MSYYQGDNMDPNYDKHAEQPQEDTTYYSEPYQYDAASTMESSSRNDEDYEPYQGTDWDYSNTEYGKLDPPPGTQKACTCKGNCAPGTGCRQETGRKKPVDGSSASTSSKGHRHRSQESKKKR